MNYILFDEPKTRLSFLPFTHTRPLADIRCGIFTMRARWEKLLQQATSTWTADYLQPVFPLVEEADNTWINGAVFGTPELAEAINALPADHKLVGGDDILAFRCREVASSLDSWTTVTEALTSVSFDGPVSSLQHIWDIFSGNDLAIRDDYALITKGRESAPVPEGVIVTGKEYFFAEPSARIQPGTVINAASGPVYIGEDSEIMEGCLIRGPFASGHGAVLKMGSKAYGATTIGPGCKVGGEISNVVFFANSNKGHDGFLGNAVIGEWCNLGADTNCSNLKNNYDEIKIWDEHLNKSVKTGLSFCGLMMGDHSKCGINTMFNTGTITGVSCNIYGGGFPEKFIPSFAWGGSDGMVTYSFTKAMDTARRMMARRGKSPNAAEEEMYRHIFEITMKQRATFLNG